MAVHLWCGLAAVLCLAALPAPGAAAEDLFTPGLVWRDDHGVPINAHGGGMLYAEGVYYWFGEHKTSESDGNAAQVGVHVYSSRDLYRWTDRGIALSVAADPESDIARGSVIERPKVLRNARTGKYVMWFHLELKGHGYNSARSGVAVADAPAGPYRFVHSLRPNAGVWPENVSPADKQPGEGNALARDFSAGQMARDMTLFMDDDGRAYEVYASEENRTLQISQLSDDYLHPAGRYVRALPLGDNEAPTVFKDRGRYFMITSGVTGWRPNAARMAEASSIWGPWRNLGNPVHGTPDERSTTFGAQGTFVFPVHGRPHEFVFMADRWFPDDPIEARYIWLPVTWDRGMPVLCWRPEWSIAHWPRCH